MKKSCLDNITITTLCENTAGRSHLISEWGLSILIETNNQSILLDTGYNNAALYNGKVMRKDFSRIDTLVLSHGHFDHTGGMTSIIREINRNNETPDKKVKVIAHPDIWGLKYHVDNENERWIGMSFSRDALEGMGYSFHLSEKPVWISENIVTTGEVEMTTDFEETDLNLMIKTKSGFIKDPFKDDLALVIKTIKGLIIIPGCSHRGIINTILQAIKITKEDNILLVLGGAHLMKASEERVEQTIKMFKQLGVKKIGLSHCTGMTTSAKFYSEFSKDFFFNNTGNIINWDDL